MWGDDETTSAKEGGFNTSSSQNYASITDAPPKRIENVVPVMLKHLTKQTKELSIWGQTVHVVTFIGILRQIEETTTKITYVIDDDTDTITAIRWLEAAKDEVEAPLELNTYVRVHGYFRVQNEARHVLILRIWPLEELNEMTNHLLEVTYAMLHLEKRHNSNNKSSNETSNCNIDCDSVSGLTKEQAVVFKLVQEQNDTLNGIERQKLISSIPKNIMPQIDNILEFLTNEGHIYTTLTDDHFKAT